MPHRPYVLPALALAAAAALLPQAAGAQALQGSAISITYANNTGNCAFTQPQILVTDGGAGLRFSFFHAGPGSRMFRVQVVLNAGGNSRTLVLGSEASAAPSAITTVQFSGVSPALPTNLAGASAAVTISDCRVGQRPMANM